MKFIGEERWVFGSPHMVWGSRHFAVCMGTESYWLTTKGFVNGRWSLSLVSGKKTRSSVCVLFQ